jgi:hypothetical protein
VKKEASGRRSVQVEVEVPGTPEEVWQAIATRPGILSWLMPTEFEVREGKLALYLRALLTGVALLILLSSARAQEPPKPSPQRPGSWKATWK